VTDVTQINSEGRVSYRQFEDEHGRLWDVWEVHPSAVERRVNEERRKAARETPDRRRNQDVQFPMPADLANGWLAFQCNDARRRLAPIPPHWHSLSEEELRALVQRAKPPRAAPRPTRELDLHSAPRSAETSRSRPPSD
jgi:hypothetical protein